MAWNTAQITTASPVLWSSGATFDGYVLLTLALPDAYTELGKSSFFPIQKLPTRIKIPVREGVINTRTRVPFTTSYEPPNCCYAVSWYDHFDQAIAAGSDITVTSDPLTLTVPTLTAPAGGDGGTPDTVYNMDFYDIPIISSVGTPDLTRSHVQILTLPSAGAITIPTPVSTLRNWTLMVKQPTSGSPGSITFAATYKGLGAVTLDPTLSTYSSFTFTTLASGDTYLTGPFVGGLNYA